MLTLGMWREDDPLGPLWCLMTAIFFAGLAMAGGFPCCCAIAPVGACSCCYAGTGSKGTSGGPIEYRVVAAGWTCGASAPPGGAIDGTYYTFDSTGISCLWSDTGGSPNDIYVQFKSTNCTWTISDCIGIPIGTVGAVVGIRGTGGLDSVKGYWTSGYSTLCEDGGVAPAYANFCDCSGGTLEIQLI